MYVDVFFEYFMERGLFYWIEILDENVLIVELDREGVLVEDDMVLWVLLLYIKFKRGWRRFGENDLGKLFL